VTAKTDDDRALVEAAQADPARFVELYERHVGRVYAYVSSRTADRATAEDITADVFERALTHLARYEWRGVPFVAWLLRIASNAIADQWRARAHEAHDPPADAPDTSELEALERRVLLFELVDRLPDLQRQVIRMRFVDDRNIREIAAALDRSEGAVKQLQLRALTNLKKEMGRHG
jgi:RNA polymerase sigma-70 factor (ECF subfamily)